MKAIITKASDNKYERVKEIKSLDDLIELGKDHALVVDFHTIWDCYRDYDVVIEIYDDWRE